MSSSWQTVDDMSPLLLYTPQSSWRLDTTVQGSTVNDGSTHSTSGDDTTVTIRFSGTAIIVYTYVKARAANYTAELDGVSTFVQLDSTSVNTTTPSATWGQLEDKEHTLVLRKERNDPSWRSNVPGNDLTYLSLDYFQIQGTLLQPPDAAPSTPNSVASSGASRGLPTAAIVGIVFGSLVALIVFGALSYVISRRSRKIPEEQSHPYVGVQSHPGTGGIGGQSSSRNELSTSTHRPIFIVPSPSASIQRPPHSPPSHFTQTSQSYPSSGSPVSPPLPTLPALSVPDEVRRCTDGSLGSAGRAVSLNTLNVPSSSRQTHYGHRRMSSGLLELPGHRFIRTGSPSKNLSSQTSSRITATARSPAGGYLSPFTSSALSGISGPIIPSPPSSPSNRRSSQSPSYIVRSLHHTLDTLRTMAANAGSDIVDRSYPGSPVQSTIIRDLSDPNDGYEPPSSPVESSIIFPASTIASSCAVPTNQM